MGIGSNIHPQQRVHYVRRINNYSLCKQVEIEAATCEVHAGQTWERYMIITDKHEEVPSVTTLQCWYATGSLH